MKNKSIQRIVCPVCGRFIIRKEVEVAKFAKVP